MYRSLKVAAAGLFIMSVLSGCVADSFGLSEKEQIEAIGKYPRTGLNLQPDDGFFMITGKVVVRTILCPLTLAISEGVLLNERNHSFSSYAVDLHNQRQMQATKAYYDSLLGKDEKTLLLTLGAPAKKETLKDGTTVLYYSNKAAAQLKFHGFEFSFVTNRIRYRNDAKGNFKSEIPRRDANYDFIYIDGTGKCFAWDVIKHNARNVFVMNGVVTFI